MKVVGPQAEFMTADAQENPGAQSSTLRQVAMTQRPTGTPHKQIRPVSQSPSLVQPATHPRALLPLPSGTPQNPFGPNAPPAGKGAQVARG